MIGTHINMILLFVVVCKRARLRISPDVCNGMMGGSSIDSSGTGRGGDVHIDCGG